MDDKKIAEYEAPKVTDHGDLVEITAALGDGSNLDKDFPVNTPKKALTFSGPV